MKNKTHIGQIDLTKEEKEFISYAINRCGDGDHPFCDEKTFSYFVIKYVRKCLKRAKKSLKPEYNDLLESINIKTK